jgi:hypothetical protein
MPIYYQRLYQHSTEFAAGCVIAGIIWTGYAAIAWRPWMR